MQKELLVKLGVFFVCSFGLMILTGYLLWILNVYNIFLMPDIAGTIIIMFSEKISKLNK
ncbi:hypothetical protein [Pelagirhabdus alkalitolerans]|uniref:hypothetical protein n=1 Tax=Pelagirhabdus alkalitolerans TaxID=1612202 RepID=UPI001C40AA45|nr:hypothetical protein [Pelagirhabdus alkalitolerans]